MPRRRCSVRCGRDKERRILWMDTHRPSTMAVEYHKSTRRGPHHHHGRHGRQHEKQWSMRLVLFLLVGWWLLFQPIVTGFTSGHDSCHAWRDTIHSDSTAPTEHEVFRYTTGVTKPRLSARGRSAHKQPNQPIFDERTRFVSAQRRDTIDCDEMMNDESFDF